METYKYQLQASYLDKTIYAGHHVWLHYKGGVYVELGSINKDISERPLVNPEKAPILTVELFKVLMRLDTVPAYGKPEKHPLEFGDIVIVYDGDLTADGIALGTTKESKRSMCECGCEGECKENEAYSEEWHSILSDDELTETAMKLSYIMKQN